MTELSTNSSLTFTKKNFPGLHNLGAQIRCAQSWYVTVQMDLKNLFKGSKIEKQN